jgi:hypothetical protein
MLFSSDIPYRYFSTQRWTFHAGGQQQVKPASSGKQGQMDRLTVSSKSAW